MCVVCILCVNMFGCMDCWARVDLLYIVAVVVMYVCIYVFLYVWVSGFECLFVAIHMCARVFWCVCMSVLFVFLSLGFVGNGPYIV